MNKSEGRLWYKMDKEKGDMTTSWTIKEVALLHFWRVIWILFYRTTPKHFFNGWRLLLLKMFGAKINGRPFVFPSSKVFAPWMLTIGHKSCLGPETEIYNLGPVILGEWVTVSQNSFLCNGTHDLAYDHFPLMIGRLIVANHVFIGARSLLLPGINIGEYAVIGAGAVVTKDVEPWTIVGGNPAKFIKKRIIKE